jgi:PAS domain S-box-containing protein
MTQQRPDNYDEASPQSAELFHLIIENIKDYAIFMTDADGRVISWNPGVEKLLGYTESEIVGKSVDIIFTPEDIAAKIHVREMETARRDGCSEDKRWHKRKDNSLFWANGLVMPLKNADGTLRGYAKVMRDDTAQRLLEERLRESEEFNLSILESSVDCVKVLDLDGNLLSMNTPGLCIMEIDDFGDFRGRRWADFWGGEGHEKALASVAAALRGEIGRFRGFAETAKGTLKYWDVIVSPILERKNGKPKQILSISRDVTDSRQTEEDLKHQKTLLEALTESILDGIVVLSTEGKILHFNRLFLDIWNFPPEVVESKSDALALEWAANQTMNPAEFLARVNAVYQQPDREVREELPMKDGRVYERFGAPILSGETRIGWVWTFRDITARKRAETNLAFLAEISQDLTGLSSSIDITQAMTGKIGKYFGASNCHFAEVDTAANTAIIDYCWCEDETVVDLTGNYQLSEFVSGEFRRTLIAGKPVVVEGVETDSRTANSAVKFQALKIGSFINTPYVSDGVLTFVLGVYHSEPYGWRADEIELLGELMTRVWARIERVRADENLRESEESYRVLAEAASDAIVRIGEDNTIQYVNTAAERIFGYTAEEMVGQQIMMLMPEEMREGHRAGMNHYLKTGKRNLDWQGIEVPAQHKDGHHFPIEISFGEYNLGDTRFFIGIIRDITERRRAQEILRESEEQLRALADSIPQLAWMAEPDGFIFWYNRRWYEYTGTTPKDMEGWGWQSVHDAEMLPNVLKLWKTSLETGEPFEMEFPLRRGDDGAFRWFLTRVVPLHDTNGRIVRWFGTNTDIEELRQARLQAEQANRLKDEFLATLSHELRTPLNAILGWSQMLQTNNLGENEVKKALATIERNARSQNQLIEDILDVSRIVTGKLRLDVRAVDLPNVIITAVDAVRPAAEAKNIRLQTLLDPQAGPISGDPDRLQQVVWNLLSNAVKFTPKNGRVQVRLERVNSHIEIVISDTGKGIEPEFLPYVFDRFRQSDGSMTRRHGGLGLGLAIVRQLVELHGGSAQVESSGEGQGATFTISLPLLPMRREQASDVPRVHPKVENGTGFDCPPELSDLRVLLVDDEADSRDLLDLVLNSCGAQVTIASSAAEAFENIKRKKFDVVVSDIGMPEEDGFSLIGKIRDLTNEQGGNVPAIALTAYARAEDRVQALRSGFQMHIAKPIEPSELIVAVANLAGRMRNPNQNGKA